MPRPTRALIAGSSVLALVVSLGLAAGSASVDAAKPPKPTPRSAHADTADRSRPGSGAACVPRTTASRRSPPRPGGSTSIGSMASRFPGVGREQLAVVVEVSGGGGRGNCWAHFPQPATGTWPNVNWDDVDLFESTSTRSTRPA